MGSEQMVENKTSEDVYYTGTYADGYVPNDEGLDLRNKSSRGSKTDTGERVRRITSMKSPATTAEPCAGRCTEETMVAGDDFYMMFLCPSLPRLLSGSTGRTYEIGRAHV